MWKSSCWYCDGAYQRCDFGYPRQMIGRANFPLFLLCILRHDLTNQVARLLPFPIGRFRFGSRSRRSVSSIKIEYFVYVCTLRRMIMKFKAKQSVFRIADIRMKTDIVFHDKGPLKKRFYNKPSCRSRVRGKGAASHLLQFSIV